MTTTGDALDLESVRTDLGSSSGKEYWRTLEELSNREEFQKLLWQEFPRQASAMTEGVDRRDFVKLMGASLAMAGLTGCQQPPQKIVPYVQTPEEIVPGKPLYFATAMPMDGGATGLLVETHMGRPTKIEGNPDHPSSLGATDAFAQASILTMYDPERSQAVRERGEVSTWSAFQSAIQAIVSGQQADGGAGLRILTQTLTSPTFGAQMKALMAQFPRAVWHQYEPGMKDGEREGIRLALGAYAHPVYKFDQANVVLSLGSDFLACGGGHLRYTRDFTNKRRVRNGKFDTSRLYVAETSPSPTGSVADHRLPVRASEMEDFARTIAGALGVAGAAPPASLPAAHAQWITALVKDLQQQRGNALVIAGEQQSPAIHAIAHAINSALGSVGKTVTYTEPTELAPVNQLESIRTLAREMHSGVVKALVIFGGNPVFDAPADLNFAAGLAKVPFRAHLSLYYDETSERCDWHIPEAHYLESWSDVRGHDGTASIIQPMIAPLYNGRTMHEVAGAMTGDATSSYDLVRTHWTKQATGADAEAAWRKSLRDGVIAGTALPVRGAGGASIPPRGVTSATSGGIEVAFKLDPTIHDGRFANNGWLQELPKPITKITWDNVALLSPRTAKRLGLETEDLITVSRGGRKMRAPVFVVPGHADDSVTVQLGYGRTRAGKVGNGAGFNAYALRTSDAPWFVPGAEVRKTGERYRLATTQPHHGMSGRDIVRSGTVAEFIKDPQLGHHGSHGAEGSTSIYPKYEYPQYAWGMSVDMSACIGCNACVVACQAENNIPVVGKSQVLNQREMHWLRIDHYYSGESDNPESFHQPVLCMHCENAPCEPVCPVEATTHSGDGLNEMTYNRCIGTRYCANNCPYKVRRFNFYEYSDFDTPSLKLMRNPDVTVRTRGVMEKCSYCVQRINSAKIEAEKETRNVRDGEVVTACQAACPAEAIVFGNIADPDSKVAKLKHEPHNYSLLGELNNMPRTTYLATIRNPNPEIKVG